MLQVEKSLENSSHISPQSVTKHPQVQHIKIIYHFVVEGVYYQFLNIISTFLKLVTIHGRNNNLHLGSICNITKTDQRRLHYIMCYIQRGGES